MPTRRDRSGQGSVRAITSLTNDRVKLVRSLEMRKARRDTGLFVAEGASVLVTAREQGWQPTMLLWGARANGSPVHEGLIQWALAAGAECLEVSDPVLEKLAAKENPQSMMAVFGQRFSGLPDCGSLPPRALWLALEEVRDPGNLGTIVRTVDAVGAAGVILVGNCCDPYSREAIRATMGSVFSTSIAKAEREAFLRFATGWPGARIATHLAASRDFREGPYEGSILLMMGSEGPGLSEALAAIATHRVRIPMAGRLDSLNLAVATALMLYEIRRADLST